MADKKSIKDRLTYFYIRRVKRWMICPCCKKGKLRISEKEKKWICKDCGYSLSADLFEDNYVFWWCDECDSFLNIQEGFDRFGVKHICQDCGYENDITFDNIKGICSDCGKKLENPDATLCDDCKKVRVEKAKKWAIRIGAILAVAAAAVGTYYAVSKGIESGKTSPQNTIPDETFNRKKYSLDWLKKATDAELEIERERVRVVYANAGKTGLSDNEVDALYWLLNRFDNEMSKRAWAGKEPGYPAHREHGWYLPNDD